ncbi:actin organization and endocytosis protein, partial [Mortierella claussenii]
MYNNFQQQQLQYQYQQQQQSQQYYQSAVGDNFQYNAGFGQPLMQQQHFHYQQHQPLQYQPARPGWAVSREEKARYDQIFSAWDPDHSGYISGERAREIFGSSGLAQADLGHIWALADPDNHGKLNKDEFAVAMHLVYRKLNGGDIPAVLPDDLIPPSTRDISETLDFVKKSLMSDTSPLSGSTNWGSYGSPSNHSPSVSLNKRLSVRSPDDVGYVSSARRGNTSSSPATSSRTHSSSETSIGRLQKQINEQRLVLEATVSRATGQSGADEDREIEDLKAQIRNAQSRLMASSNEAIHRRIASGAEDLAHLREERRNMDQEVAGLLRTVATLASKVRETDRSLEESRLEVAKLKIGSASGGDAEILGTGPGGAVTAEDRMKARIALMKAQRMAALTGKPIPSAAQTGIDPDKAARIRAERDVNEQNVVEVETTVRRLEDTMRQLERNLDIHTHTSRDGRIAKDRRQWGEGAGVQSEIVRRFIQEIRPSDPSITSYRSPSSSINHVRPSLPAQGRDSTASHIPDSPSLASSSPLPSSSSNLGSSLTGKSPEERRAIIRAQAEKRLRDRQNELLAKSQSTRSETASPSSSLTASEVDTYTSAKFEEAERLAREKLLANAEARRRQAEQERQVERDMIAVQEQSILEATEARERELADQETRAQREAQQLKEAADLKAREEEETRLANRDRELQEERERKERFALSAAAAKQQQHPQTSSSTFPAQSATKEPIRITLDSNPFAKHRKSISSSDDDWDTASPVNSSSPAATASSVDITAASKSNNPFLLMMSSSSVPLAPASVPSHSKDTSDGWDVVEKDVEWAEPVSQKSTAPPFSYVASVTAQVSSTAVPLSATGSAIPPPPPQPPFNVPESSPMPSTSGLKPSAAIPVPPPPPTIAIPNPPPAAQTAIPAPPPPPAAAGSSSLPLADGARGALLSQIQTGIRLKKAVTKDKSGTKGIGRVLGDEGSSSTSHSGVDVTTASHIAPNSDQRPLGMPNLGGLFAGGMPTLKKSPGVATGKVDSESGEYDSRRESTDWFGRLASNAPADTVYDVSTSSATPSSEAPAIAAITPSVQDTPAQDQPPSATAQANAGDNSIESKVDFANGYRVRTLWSYKAMTSDQISIDANEYLRAFPFKDTDNVDWVYGVSEKDETKGWLPKTYIQQVPEKFRAKALFAYTMQNEGEMTIERGEIVDVLEKPDPQWWRVQNPSGMTGMLPATYLEEYIEGQLPAVEIPIGNAKALYTYAGQSAEELSVEVGELLEIIAKPDPLWWRVRNSQGNFGMLPSTYLEELEGHSTSAFTVGDSDSSEYESADDASQDHKTDQPSQSESSDTATETSSDEYDDGDDDGGQCHDLDFITNSSVGVTLEQPSTASTPAIAIAHAPRYRTPPPRPTGSYPRPASKTSLLGTSAPSRSSPLSQDQSKDSHLVVLSSNSLGVAGRQRSCSHSSILGTSLSHPRLTSEGSYGSTTASATAPLVRSFSPRLLDSPPWSSTVSNDILQSLPEQEKKRQEAIHELITTEQVYLSYLYLVIDEFQTPLLDQQLITQAESRSIFTDWSSLSELSQSIVDELTRRQKSDAGVVLAVGDVINSRLVERADCFMLYCANYRDASILLAKRVSESKSLRDFLK